jgi:hypothetical protein
MNASDITKLKQSQTQYNAYYNPIAYQSTIISTISPISSILKYTDVGPVNVLSTSYSSTVKTYLTYSANPPYRNYQIANTINSVIHTNNATTMDWKNTDVKLQYIYNTIYSSFNTPPNIIPSSITITSTNITTSAGPRTESFLSYTQGPHIPNNP